MEPSPPQPHQKSAPSISASAALAAAGQTVPNVLVLGAAFGLTHLAFAWQPWLGWLLWTPLTLVVVFDLLKSVLSAGMGILLFANRRKLDDVRRADQPTLLLADGINLLANTLLSCVAYLTLRSQL